MAEITPIQKPPARRVLATLSLLLVGGWTAPPTSAQPVPVVAPSELSWTRPAVVSSRLASVKSYRPASDTGAQADALPIEVPEIDPLTVTPEMAAFLAEHIDPGMQREARLRKLQEVIFDPDEGLGIVYGTHGTFTAAETFRRAEGNCLSFTLLFVTMARHLGFITHFIEVDEVTGWSHEGDVSFNHWHMLAEVEMANGYLQVDFLPWAERRYKARERIEESRVRAHFYNNVGAQKLTGDGDDAEAEARAYFRKALELDETFTPARLNLAVAERRLGHTARAEAHLLRILEVEPNSLQAATNLANLYASQGRDDEAEQWIKRRDRFQRQNPFFHFRLGLRALQANLPDEARTHFRRAIARQVDEAVFHQHLAEAYYRLGKINKAKISLQEALEHSREPNRRRILEAALQRLES